MNPNTKEAYDLLHNGILALQKMEMQGLRIDVEYIQQKKKSITKEIHDLEQKFMKSKFYKDWDTSSTTKVNIYSPVQLGKFLYTVKKIKIKKETASGQGATDEEALQQLGIPELNILLKIKKLKKIRDTYLAGFEREQIDGIIHPFYDLHLVRTYRGSSNSPNFQNIPKRDKEAMDATRKAIYPRPGHQLLEIDFGQLEVRISACYNQDDQLIYDILHGDMHKDMAVEIFHIKKYDKEKHGVLRQAAKNGFVFPQFYGDYYVNCAIRMANIWCGLPKTGKWKKDTGIKIGDEYISNIMLSNGYKSMDDFSEHIKKIESNFWGKRYKKYDKWKDSMWAEYQENGYINSFTGFTYQGVMKKNDAINYPIQGSAFHCLLWSIIEITKAQEKEKWNTRLVGQIHDAIVLDVDPAELEHIVKVIKCIMCHDILKVWKWITVPLVIDAELCPVDSSWAEKQPYKIN
jgi:DNA polymerase-1